MKLPLVILPLLAVFLLAGCAAKPATSADIPTGKWSGDYGPDANRRDPVSLELSSKDGKLQGTVHAGPRSMPLSNIVYKAETGAITMEFDAQGHGGRTIHYQIDGKIEGNTMSGSWTHDGERGDFHMMKE